MALTDARTARVLTTVLVFALVLGFLYVARQTLIAFLFAIFFAYLVDPAVSRVQRWTRSRGAAIAVIYLLILVFLVTLFFFVGPKIAHQTQRLTATLPGLLDQLSSGNIAETLGREHGWSGNTIVQTRAFLASHRTQFLGLVQRLGLRAAEVAKDSWLLVLIPILAAFFLKDGSTFSETALTFVHTRPQREFFEGVRADLNQMLAHFIRAQLTLAALTLVAYTSFLGAMRVPYAAVLGTAGGMLEFIPVVGPLVAAVIIIGVSLLTSYPHWIILLVFLGAWRLMQDYVISPRIMGRSLELHPLAALFGVLAGGEIAGVLGIYLSIPVMASLRIVARRWQLYAEKKRFGPLDEYSFGTEINREP